MAIKYFCDNCGAVDWRGVQDAVLIGEQERCGVKASIYVKFKATLTLLIYNRIPLPKVTICKKCIYEALKKEFEG